MKKMKAFNMAMFFAIAMGSASSAFAFDKDQFDGEWFNARVKTTVKKNHSISYLSDAPYSLNTQSIVFDSGKNRCYSALDWLGDAINPGYTNPDRYYLVTVCEGPNGWEWLDYKSLDLLSDGSIGDDWGWVYVTAAGKTRYPVWTEWAGYEGTFVLKTSFKSDGSTKNIQLIQPQDGMIYYGNDDTEIYGTARSGFSFKYVKDQSKVPAGAKACLASVIDPADTSDDSKCELAFWQQLPV